MATHAARQVDKVGGVADGTDTLGDRLTRLGEALVFIASGCDGLRHLLQAHCRLWRTTWTTLCRRTVSRVEVLVHPLQRLFGGLQRLCGSPLFGGHRG
jgi:hypothetical protein